MARILVTGSSGLIGSHLVKNLKSKDHTVITIERDVNKSIQSGGGFVARGDITDFNFMRRVVSDYEVQEVYHLAAQSIVRNCASDPVSAYQTNVMGTVNLLEAIRIAGMNSIKSIVVSTSDKAYGHSPAPYTEDTPLQPKYTYEATKACQDIVSQNYFYNYDLPIKIARCSNIFGPADPNWSRLIPNSIRLTLGGRSPEIASHVKDYIREFIYIDDVIEAFKLISSKGIDGEAYCIGGANKISVIELANLIIQLCQKDIEPEIITSKNQIFKEIKEQFIDASKLNKLGWSVKTDLKTGLLKTIQAYKEAHGIADTLPSAVWHY